MLEDLVRELKARLVGYARFVEDMVGRSIGAVFEKDAVSLREIIRSSEPAANDRELELEQECTSMIALHQPRARDLRSILMVLGMTNDLERMADHAVNIAEAGLRLLENPAANPPDGLREMARRAIGMVDRGIRAFVEESPEEARGVCADDGVVDDLAAEMLKDALISMEKDPSLIGHEMLLLKIASNLERIADLSTNICEDVIYLVEGRVIKHHKGD
jgi:phosphate transport system protein